MAGGRKQVGVSLLWSDPKSWLGRDKGMDVQDDRMALEGLIGHEG